jgi:hypothetical protein
MRSSQNPFPLGDDEKSTPPPSAQRAKPVTPEFKAAFHSSIPVPAVSERKTRNATDDTMPKDTHTLFKLDRAIAEAEDEHELAQAIQASLKDSTAASSEKMAAAEQLTNASIKLLDLRKQRKTAEQALEKAERAKQNATKQAAASREAMLAAMQALSMSDSIYGITSQTLFSKPENTETQRPQQTYNSRCYTDITNPLFSANYDPWAVESALKRVLGTDEEMENALPGMRDLNNLLSSIFFIERDALTQPILENLKSLTRELLLQRKRYFTKMDPGSSVLYELKTLFPTDFDAFFGASLKPR